MPTKIQESPFDSDFRCSIQITIKSLKSKEKTRQNAGVRKELVKIRRRHGKRSIAYDGVKCKRKKLSKCS